MNKPDFDNISILKLCVINIQDKIYTLGQKDR
jgi:hypothetical protein